MQITTIPKVIIGLGNPGNKFIFTRHNIGFRILDALAERYGASWRMRDSMELAQVTINNTPIMLIKPQTFMNNSGVVCSFLAKQGIKAQDILVVHDELELPFSKLLFKIGGSAKGHNGLRSLISACGDQFTRLRFGIDRPIHREDVPDYVLRNFTENPILIEQAIDQAITNIEELYR